MKKRVVIFMTRPSGVKEIRTTQQSGAPEDSNSARMCFIAVDFCSARAREQIAVKMHRIRKVIFPDLLFLAFL